MKCVKCGKVNEKDSKYCIICGTDLNNPSSGKNNEKIYEDIVNNLSERNNLSDIQKFRFHNKLSNLDFKEDFYDVALNLLNDEIEYYSTLDNEEYNDLVMFAKNNIIDLYNGKGVNFTEDLGKQRVSETILQNIEETVPVTVNEYSDFSRSLSTAMFGLTGLASTSGIKTEFVSITKQIPIQKTREINKINHLLINLKESGFYVKNKEINHPLLITFEDIEDIGFDGNIFYIATNNGTFSFIHSHIFLKI